METYQENTEAFAPTSGSSSNGSGNGGGGGGSRQWHQPRPYATQQSHSPPGNSGFQQEQFNHPAMHQGLPPYTSLNIPHHSSSGGQPSLDDLGPARRRSGSGGSELNSEGGSPLTHGRGVPFAMPVSSAGGMVPSSPSMPSVVDGSNLFESMGGGLMGPGIAGSLATTGGPLFSAAFMSAAATSTPANLLRHYYQTMGQAGQRRQRSEKKPIPDDQKDEKYFERRRRNNGAAKRSRDQRKKREDEVAIRASHLQRENAVLRTRLTHMKQNQARLRLLLCGRDPDLPVDQDRKFFLGTS